MSSVKLKVPCPAPVPMPRGAIWAAAAVMAVWRASDTLWQALVTHPAKNDAPRSAAALHRLAGDVEREQPSLAWEVRAIARHLRTFESAPGQTTTGGAR